MKFLLLVLTVLVTASGTVPLTKSAGSKEDGGLWAQVSIEPDFCLQNVLHELVLSWKVLLEN